MALLLETSLGDLTIDLDITNSPSLCHNIIKLAKSKYYTNTLIYNVQHNRFCQLGDPKGDGSGGCSIYGLIDATLNNNNTDSNSDTNAKYNGSIHVEMSKKRFLKSHGNKRIQSKQEMQQKGLVVATEMSGIPHTLGSQFLITIDEGVNKALDGLAISDDTTVHSDDNESNNDKNNYYSLGKVTEDPNDVLSKINQLYCDPNGRPYTDIRIIRMHILDDPYYDQDPEHMDVLLQKRNVQLMNKHDLPTQYEMCSNWISCSSPNYNKPIEEVVEDRISYDDARLGGGDDLDEDMERKRNEETLKKEDRSNAAILEMLGDIGSADMKPPENVLFVCKLNPMTEDEDLQLIFSRFDPHAKAEIIRDPDTGDSLQYAFIEFETKEACNEAYFKMNNALVDDRRIKVDFSQSVAKEWNRYTQQQRRKRNGFRGGGRYGAANYHNKPKEEKKYYGGYRNGHSQNTYMNDMDRLDKGRHEGSYMYHTNNNNDDGERRRKGTSSFREDDSLSSTSSRSRSRSSSSVGDDLDRKRKHRKRKSDKSSSSRHSQRHSSREDDRDGRHRKKRTHRDHKHRKKHSHRHDEDRDRKRGDRKKSSKRHKYATSLRGRRSHSKDHDDGKKRHRSRSR